MAQAGLEHVLVVPGPDDAGLAKNSAKDLIVSSQRGYVRSYRLLARIGPSGLEAHMGSYHIVSSVRACSIPPIWD
jgi:hypothetical protein